MKISEKLYNRYEYLAVKYSNKIFSYDELSYEYSDLLQEFRLKIFTSIKSYGRRWGKYRRNEAPKPVPLRFYLEAACSNKACDFAKYISRENHKTSIDEITYDFGVENNCYINPSENKFIVNDIDLLEGLSGVEKSIFSLFLRGNKINFINKVFNNNKTNKKIDITNIIKKQREFLIKKYGNDLLKKNVVYSNYNIDED